MSSKYMIERLRILLRWREYVPSLVKALEKVFPDCEAYIVGGVAEDRITALSDIDVLIVCDRVPSNVYEKAEKTSRIREELERLGVEWSYLFEFHIISRESMGEYMKYYKRLVKIKD